MKEALLIISIILLLVYAFLMVDTFILIKKSTGKRISGIRDILMKRINLAIILTVAIAALIIIRIIAFK